MGKRVRSNNRRAAFAACAITLCVIIPNAHAWDVKAHAANVANAAHDWYTKNVSGKEAEVYTTQEHNRSYEHCWDLAATASLTLYERLNLRGGFAYGMFGEAGEVKAFGRARIGSDPTHPWGELGLVLHTIYTESDDYEIETGSILMLMSVDSRKLRAGFNVGGNLLFSSYFDDPYFYEPYFSYSMYYDFVRNDRWGLRGTLANYSDFSPRLAGGWASFWLTSNVRVSKRWSVVNEVQFYNCGEDIFSMVYYGTAWRGGAKFSW